MNLKYIPQVIGLLLSIEALFLIALYPTVTTSKEFVASMQNDILTTVETTHIKIAYWNSDAVLLSIFGFLICLIAELVSRIKPT
jgi:hypothetical protein